MRVGIIDLGTNSVRFDVHQMGPSGIPKLLHREKIMVRLGQGVFVDGKLDPAAEHRTIHAFNIFKKLAAELRVTRIVALGTSALREAADSARFVEKVRRSTKIDLRVISGPEEARLIALGILSNTKIKGRTGLIDIGGGSTEISITQGKKVMHSESFPLGTARLQQVFLKKSPPSSESLDQMRLYVRKVLSSKIIDQKWARPAGLVGSSGTVRALIKIVRKGSGKKGIKLKELSELIKKMRRMTTTQLLGVPGMEAKRVDMILAGAVLLEECMIALRAEKLYPTDYSLRDGILEEQSQLSRKHLRSQIAFHLDDLCVKAEQFGLKRKSIQSALAMSDTIFKGLRPVHKLGPEWRIYLDAASIFRNSGENISLIGHNDHSYYIVKNAKFPFVEEWESEIVAKLCLFHERHQLTTKDLEFEKSRARRDGFQKLLAMLCLVDALEVDPASPPVVLSVRASKSSIVVRFTGGTNTDLEAFRVEQRRSLFKSAFRRTVELRRV